MKNDQTQTADEHTTPEWNAVWLGDAKERACEAIYQQLRRTFPEALPKDILACMAVVRIEIRNLHA